MSSTPKVLYQTWKTQTLPEKFEKNRNRWIAATPGYEHILLDDQGLRDLVSYNFPQYLEAYDSFTKNIERVDFARCVMMWLGGVYADLDTYPLKSIDKFVAMDKIVLGREPLEHAHSLYSREVVLCNAFMISPPGKRLWVDLMEHIIENYEPHYRPVENTGPMALTRFYEKHPELFKDVLITDPCTFFPLTGQGKVTQGCDIEKNTHVVHEWTNSWVPNIWTDDMWKNKRYWFWALLAIFFLVFGFCWYTK